MNSKILTDYYNPLLAQHSFRPISYPEHFSPAGSCWEISPELGGGYSWVYAQKNLFDIKIHNFFFHEDFYLELDIPECISILRYDSISGEELSPYRRLSAGDIETIVGGKQKYRALIHKRIPIHSVGIEILPEYYEDYLKKQYPDEYFDLSAAFQSIDQAAKQEHPLSKEDIAGLENVVSYINDHYAFDIPLERLSNIACMSISKLKTCFKRRMGCTVTEYIQARRMSQAEHLLINTDFTMGQIA